MSELYTNVGKHTCQVVVNSNYVHIRLQQESRTVQCNDSIPDLHCIKLNVKNNYPSLHLKQKLFKNDLTLPRTWIWQ